jgi:hypothetical protein
MTVDTRKSRPEQIESAIRTLRDVEEVSVRTDGTGITEIHVLTSSERPAKQIVRDISTLIRTRFGQTIDHRVVSVAYTREGVVAAEEQASAPEPLADAPLAPRAERIRFVSVNLYVSGPRAQAQVELRWKGLTRMGSATGTATRDGAHELVATATVAALEEFLEDDVSLGVSGVEFVRLGRSESAVVGLTLLAHRQEKMLAGCCTVEQDVPQAVALATLAALNRVVGGLETREPTEYVLRPTSNQEASEAK